MGLGKFFSYFHHISPYSLIFLHIDRGWRVGGCICGFPIMAGDSRTGRGIFLDILKFWAPYIFLHSRTWNMFSLPSLWQVFDIFLHIFHTYFFIFLAYSFLFSHIPSYFWHSTYSLFRSYLLHQGIPECDVISGGGCTRKSWHYPTSSR